jgi:predicted transcriptional regulator
MISKNDRLAITRMVLKLIVNLHRWRFPAGRKLGPDIILTVVFAASVNTYDEGLPVTASKIAHFLELPRETTRRHLETLVRFGLLKRRDRNYSPTEWAVYNYTNKAADLVKETAAML